MANLIIPGASETGRGNATVKTTVTNGVHVPSVNIDTAVPITDNSGSITVDGSVTVSGTATTTAAASEAFMGHVGGVMARCNATITGSTSPAYASGDLVGGKLTLSNAARVSGSSGIVQSAIITSKSLQNNVVFDVVFFNADPSNSTFTDNAAFDIHDNDLDKVIGVAQCNTVIPFSGSSVHQALGLALPFAGSAGSTTLYAAVITRSTTTLAGTTDLTLSVRILQD